MKLAGTLLASALLAPGLALAQQPAAAPPAVVAESAERTAIVESVNTTERSVLLRGDSGSQAGALATVRVGPQVRNLAQVRPGDRVVLSVTDAVAASVARAGDGLAPTGEAAVATRNAAGERPGASLTEGKRVRVRVDSVDVGRNSVTFTEPDGTRKSVRVQNPRMREFIRTLSTGDQVDVVYLESVSLRVLPPG